MNPRHGTARRLGWSLALAASSAVLSGCGGSLYATIQSSEGDPVMLLGHDPVAYFTWASRSPSIRVG